jgi:hypothetical protein
MKPPVTRKTGKSAGLFASASFRPNSEPHYGDFIEQTTGNTLFHSWELSSTNAANGIRHVFGNRPQNLIGAQIVQKFFFFIALAASCLGVGGGTPCFAAGDTSPASASSPSSPQAMRQQATQNKARRPSQRKMHRMRKSGGMGSSTVPDQEQVEAPSNPSQRSMRQKLKAAKPVKVPETANPEPR